MKSNYVLTPAYKTTCQACGQHVCMLMDEAMDPTKPAFYVCFECRTIGEIGKGPVYVSQDLQEFQRLDKSQSTGEQA